jgi:ABC-type glutathione transport system ATPase component
MRAEERRAIVAEGERDARQTPNGETRMTLRGRTTTAAGTEAHEPILSARGIVKTYRTGTQEVHALHGVDLDVRAGELVTIMRSRRETP